VISAASSNTITPRELHPRVKRGHPRVKDAPTNAAREGRDRFGVTWDSAVHVLGAFLFFGTVVAVILGGWLLRRWSGSVDDYYERDYQDPPIFDARSFLGGGNP
jgi:hypothetical protein